MNQKEITRPQFLDEQLTDILSNKTKEIVSINELVEANDKLKKNENEKTKEKNTEQKPKENIEDKNIKETSTNTNTNIIIPKMNPLSGMSKNFNKFDIVPGNALPGMMMPFTSTTWIPNTNNEK